MRFKPCMRLFTNKTSHLTRPKQFPQCLSIVGECSIPGYTGQYCTGLPHSTCTRIPFLSVFHPALPFFPRIPSAFSRTWYPWNILDDIRRSSNHRSVRTWCEGSQSLNSCILSFGRRIFLWMPISGRNSIAAKNLKRIEKNCSHSFNRPVTDQSVRGRGGGGGIKWGRKPQNHPEIRQKTANRIGLFPEYRNRTYVEKTVIANHRVKL